MADDKCAVERRLLDAARHALRSYQHGNASPELARCVADSIDRALDLAITCPRCNRTSHNLNDVLQRYCGFCHAFHEDMPEANEGNEPLRKGNEGGARPDWWCAFTPHGTRIIATLRPSEQECITELLKVYAPMKYDGWKEFQARGFTVMSVTAPAGLA